MLNGRNTEVIADLAGAWNRSQALKLEDEARLRDQISCSSISRQSRRSRGHGRGHRRGRHRGQGGEYCVSVVFVRGGRNLGSSNYFPRGGLGGEEEALAAILAQYYLARGAPAEILVNLPLEDSTCSNRRFANGAAIRFASAETSGELARAGLRWRAPTRNWA